MNDKDHYLQLVCLRQRKGNWLYWLYRSKAGRNGVNADASLETAVSLTINVGRHVRTNKALAQSLPEPSCSKADD